MVPVLQHTCPHIHKQTIFKLTVTQVLSQVKTGWRTWSHSVSSTQPPCDTDTGTALSTGLHPGTDRQTSEQGKSI